MARRVSSELKQRMKWEICICIRQKAICEYISVFVNWFKCASTPQVEQTKRPVCVSGQGIWMASGKPGRLVVTQVTPEVPGEKHIAADCSGKEALKRYWRWHSSVFIQQFFYYITRRWQFDHS